MALLVHTFKCLNTNIGMIVHDTQSKISGLIDAPEKASVTKAIIQTGWIPSFLLNTHHHIDHTGANIALKKRFNLKIFACHDKQNPIPGVDKNIKDGDEIDFLEEKIKVIATPGHTRNHISFYAEKSGILFTGDCLFVLGCGRLFECNPEIMHHSLSRLATFPDKTRIYCGHEYALQNARFTLTIDPTNEQLIKITERIRKLYKSEELVQITTIHQERMTNPFLRVHDRAIRENLNMNNASDLEVFTEIRQRKDLF